MQDPLQELETTYFMLQSTINALTQACQTREQTDILGVQYVKARQNYWACVNRAFHDDDPQVMSLTNLIDAANQDLSKAVQQMGNITNTINDITKVVTLGEQLASKVITI